MARRKSHYADQRWRTFVDRMVGESTPRPSSLPTSIAGLRFARYADHSSLEIDK